MGTVTKVYTPANIIQGPADLYVDVASPPSSTTPSADSNILTLNSNGEPTDNGIAQPPVPTLSEVPGGTLGATTYYVKLTYINDTGESLPSPEATLAVAANKVLQVASPSASFNAIGYNVYVSSTPGTETRQNQSAPVSIGSSWMLPTAGLVSGAVLPTTNTTPMGFHVGSVEGPTEIQITEKFNEIRDDQHESPIDLCFDTVEAEIDVTIKEAKLGNVQKYLSAKSVGVSTLLQSQDVLQLGGQLDSSKRLRSFLIISPRRDAGGKFLYLMVYKAFLNSALQLSFHRSKENLFKLKFRAVADTARAAGDELMQIVKAK